MQDNENLQRRVLVIEDDPIIRYLHKTMLEALDCYVDLAFNGEQASLLANNSYDLILLDIGLPEQNGIQVATDLKRSFAQQQTPIIAITTFSKELITQECEAAGIEKIYAKPIHIKDLQAILASLEERQPSLSH